jgi:hypothetical protein
MRSQNPGTSIGEPAASSPGVNQLREVIVRLVAAIEEENHILAERRELSLDSIIYKKSQLLLELMRAQKSCGEDHIKSFLGHDIRRFKNLMSVNQRLLSVHLTAAREVSNTILDVLRQNDSDGTYAGSAYVSRGIQ